MKLLRGYEETACTHCGTLTEHPVGGGLRGPHDEPLCSECYPIFEYFEIDKAILGLCEYHKITLKRLAERTQVLLVMNEGK